MANEEAEANSDILTVYPNLVLFLLFVGSDYYLPFVGYKSNIVSKKFIPSRGIWAWLIQLGDGKGSHSIEAVPLMRALSEAKAYASKDQVLHGRLLSPHILRDHIQTKEKQVMLNEAMGFSDLTQLHQLLSGSSTNSELLQEDTTQLWWAGKELMKSKRLCDYVGDNERTKIILRLQPSCISSA
ncbi:cilia- and flagella-associated protein 298-like [Telopea speciosissima]|uniref:cilia- and flagella-associated protein 298-like n=1 Tax=Telopea speciosissima TaxID=54955 RepID=UPI001CC6CBEB|nr:cilia- and flagella-associated protein 298-like [Telopea speciosissima]